MNAQAALLDEPVRNDTEFTEVLTIDTWMRQVVARSDSTVHSIAAAMQADGLGEAEAHVLAALGILRDSNAPLSAALRPSRLQDSVWALLQHFRTACSAEFDTGAKDAGAAIARPVSPRDLDRNVVLQDGRSIEVRATCRSPDLALFDNVLSAEECDALIELSRERMAPSMVMASGENMVDSTFRSSSGGHFEGGSSTLLNTLQARIAELTQWPASFQENWAIARYLPGQQFKPHWDFFDTDPTKANHRAAMASGGQRIGTVVLYLSDMLSGGGTVFDFAGLEVRPRKGSAVYFAYQLSDGGMDVSSMHSGAPVNQGEKWIASVWLRERPVLRARLQKVTE